MRKLAVFQATGGWGGGLLPQIIIFRVAVHKGLHEWADGNNFQSQSAGGVEDASGERGTDSTAFEHFWDFGVQDREHAIRPFVIGKSNMPVGVEFEAVAFRVVANVTGHCHGLCTILI